MKRNSPKPSPTPLGWLVASLLGNNQMCTAAARLARYNRTGLRHFSANRKAVPLDQTEWMVNEIARCERELEAELGIFPTTSAAGGAANIQR